MDLDNMQFVSSEADRVPPDTRPTPTAFGSESPPSSSKVGGLRRLAATVALAIGLLAVGGASVVMAASPAPAASSSPPTTQTTPGGSGTHSGNCPNMSTNGSSGSSGSSSSPTSTSGS
jgi:hypothetical protein